MERRGVMNICFWTENNKKQKDLEHEVFGHFKRKPEKRKSVLLQYAAAMTACLPAAGLGCIMSWTSPAIPHLISNKSEFPVTVNQSAWIASLNSVGVIIGYLLIPLILRFLSPKNTLLLITVPQFTSWILIIFGRNYIILFIGRILGGLGYGAGLCATSVYVGEIGDENTRGSFLVIIKLAINSGILFTMVVGACLSYNEMNLVLLSLPIFFILTFSFMPHSSYFNQIQDSDETEEINLMKTSDLLEPDLRTELESGAYTKNQNHQYKSEKNILWRLFVLRNNQKALLIILIISLTDIFSGHVAIVSYTQQIFDYSGASLKAEYAALVLAVLRISASLISILVVERFKRRVLFLTTGILAAFSQGLVGLFFFLKMYLKVDVSYITWLPLFGLSMYEVVVCVGLSSLYYVYQGELFSNDVKGPGVTCTNIVYECIGFFVKFYFQIVNETLGIYTLFWGFGFCCVIGSVLAYWISPETKGKSLEEIQNSLRGDRKI